MFLTRKKLQNSVIQKLRTISTLEPIIVSLISSLLDKLLVKFLVFTVTISLSIMIPFLIYLSLLIKQIIFIIVFSQFFVKKNQMIAIFAKNVNSTKKLSKKPGLENPLLFYLYISKDLKVPKPKTTKLMTMFNSQLII